MSTINTKKEAVYTHEGAKAQNISHIATLRRTIMSCMLWEDSFYENGESIEGRIRYLCIFIDTKDICKIAIEAREKMLIRHAPLLLIVYCCKKEKRNNRLISKTLSRIITRPDDLTEFLALYWKDCRCPICKGAKKGLAQAFEKFDEYQLAKYNRKKIIKLKDILMLTHPKPKNKEQEILWKKLLDDKLATPYTWEVELSKKGINKRLIWQQLLTSDKLGDLALLRNLRNMFKEWVQEELIKKQLEKRKFEKILPFSFIAAAKAIPSLESILEEAMLDTLKNHKKIKGTTVILVDISYSMNDSLSKKSELSRVDAANGIAIFAKEICEKSFILSFSDNLTTVPDRKGFSLADAIKNSQEMRGTYLGDAIKKTTGIFELSPTPIERLIVITDEQSHDNIPACPFERGYIINVAPYKNGIGYGNGYVHIDGFSKNVLDYILEYEADQNIIK